MMFRQIMFLNWKVSKFAVAILLPLCLGLPIALLRLSSDYAAAGSPTAALDMLRATQSWARVFPLLAGAAGCTIALCVWAWDHRTNHVYALSLPIDRWRYALLKLTSGISILAVLFVAVLVGALLAITLVDLPTGIRGYPFAFGVRFFFAALLTYAITFAFAAGTMKTTIRVFVLLFAVFIGGGLITDFVGDAIGRTVTSPIALLHEALVTWPGPFNVFGGSWMLIDV
jgi:hypothetical protein